MARLAAADRKLKPETLATMRRSCLTVDELSDVLQTSPERVREMVMDGCPCVNLQRKPVTNSNPSLRFDLDKVLLWLSSYSRAY